MKYIWNDSFIFWKRYLVILFEFLFTLTYYNSIYHYRLQWFDKKFAFLITNNKMMLAYCLDILGERYTTI